MNKLSIRELKKRLGKKTKAELVDEIATLVKKYKQVQEYYYSQNKPENLKETLENYKQIIEREFIEGKTRGMPKLRFAVARKAINDFKKINQSPAYMVDLMLCYAESISWFSSNFGPNSEEFYTKPENMFKDALELARKNGIENDYKGRAFDMVARACDGWGHQDTLKDMYYDVYGEFGG